MQKLDATVLILFFEQLYPTFAFNILYSTFYIPSYSTKIFEDIFLPLRSATKI